MGERQRRVWRKEKCEKLPPASSEAACCGNTPNAAVDCLNGTDGSPIFPASPHGFVAAGASDAAVSTGKPETFFFLNTLECVESQEVSCESILARGTVERSGGRLFSTCHTLFPAKGAPVVTGQRNSRPDAFVFRKREYEWLSRGRELDTSNGCASIALDA